MALPDIVSREEWRTARVALLEREKALTRARDELNADRRRLPMVEVATPYTFDGPEGEVGLLDLFDGRRQLIVYHFMFQPGWEEPCPSCSSGADEASQGLLDHLHARDTTFVYVSRAPYEMLARTRAARGWVVPWYSSANSRFNVDFQVTIDESVAPAEYNYRSLDEHAAHGWDMSTWEQPFDLHGHSCFLRDGDRVFHTYSMFGRGAETVGGSYYFLDLTALGRQEDWEKPAGRSTDVRDASPDLSS
jgi:predicted dithiol-disulfide oxidoreductase (DUF899 family)